MITAYINNLNTHVNYNTYQITDTISGNVTTTPPVQGAHDTLLVVQIMGEPVMYGF